MNPDTGQIIYYILLGVAALAAAIYAGRKHPSSAWQSIVKELQEQLDDQGNELERLKQAVNTLRIQVADKEIELHRLEAEKVDLEKRVAALEKENASLRGKLDYERQKRRELEAKVKAGNAGA